MCPPGDHQGHLRSPPGDYIPASLLRPFPEASVKHSEKGREVFSDGSNSVKGAGAASQACGPPWPGIRTRFYRVTLHEEEQTSGHLLTAPCRPRPGRPHTHTVIAPRFFHGLLTTRTHQGSCAANDPGACYSRTIPKPFRIKSLFPLTYNFPKGGIGPGPAPAPTRSEFSPEGHDWAAPFSQLAGRKAGRWMMALRGVNNGWAPSLHSGEGSAGTLPFSRWPCRGQAGGGGGAVPDTGGGKVPGRTKPVGCARPDCELCGFLRREPCPRPGNHCPDQDVPGGLARSQVQVCMQGAGGAPWCPTAVCGRCDVHPCQCPHVTPPSPGGQWRHLGVLIPPSHEDFLASPPSPWGL